jgi:outer membrane protein assembly factor BamE
MKSIISRSALAGCGHARTPAMRFPFAPSAALAACALVAGCASLQSSDNLLGVITPYKVDVVQGNVVTAEQYTRVRPGMSRAQVRDLLGSPLLADIFHADRWDYVFTIRRQGAEPQARRVTVRFDGEMLARIEGGEGLPSERDFVASIDTQKASRTAPKLALTEDELRALAIPERPAPPASEPSGPVRSYPPLEASR